MDNSFEKKWISKDSRWKYYSNKDIYKKHKSRTPSYGNTLLKNIHRFLI